MDSEALVTLRLLKSGGKNFDLNVTRYTNYQNPIQDRDFYANDDVQIRLQNESYQTNIWYEKRKGEFRETPEGVKKVPNFIFANLYLAYHLQDPVSVLNNRKTKIKRDIDLNFISDKDDKNGFYEKIFNANTSFQDMLCAYYLFDTINISYENTFSTNIYHLLPLFKVAFTKYLTTKYGGQINVNKQIIKIYEQGEKELIIKTFKFINQFVEKQIEVADNKEKRDERMFNFLFTLSDYQKIYNVLEGTEISVKDIDEIVLENNDDIIKTDKDTEITGGEQE